MLQDPSKLQKEREMKLIQIPEGKHLINPNNSNNNINEGNNIKKLIDISHCVSGIPFNLVETMGSIRKFIHESDLIKLSSKGKNMNVHFFLFNDIIIYTKPSFGKMYNYRQYYNVSTCFVKNMNDSPVINLENAFQLEVQLENGCKRKLLLKALSVDEKKIWMEHLTSVISKYINSKQTPRFSNSADIMSNNSNEEYNEDEQPAEIEIQTKIVTTPIKTNNSSSLSSATMRPAKTERPRSPTVPLLRSLSLSKKAFVTLRSKKKITKDKEAPVTP